MKENLYHIRIKFHGFLKYLKQCNQKRQWHWCNFFSLAYKKRVFKIKGVDSLVYLQRNVVCGDDKNIFVMKQVRKILMI